MTTSRIYAYRWPARLVSHKPFAAERYSITSSCIWQVFFRKNADFLFLFAPFHLPGDFLCRMHNRVAAFSVESPAQGIECPFSGRFILKTSPSSLRDATSPVRGGIGKPGHFVLTAESFILRKRAGLAYGGSIQSTKCCPL